MAKTNVLASFSVETNVPARSKLPSFPPSPSRGPTAPKSSRGSREGHFYWSVGSFEEMALFKEKDKGKKKKRPLEQEGRFFSDGRRL
jgi:hypothetical protein